jgi:spermidine synthase
MLLFLVGLLAIICQIVLLRELNVACYGVELIFGIALAGWMIAGGAGAAWRSRQPVVPSVRIAWLLTAASVALPADVALVRASRLILGGVPGAFLPFGQQLLVLAVSLAPLSFALGLAFRQAAQASALHGRSLALCYAIESAGAVVGATAATVALASGAQTLTLAILTAGAVTTTLLVSAIRKPTAAAACLVTMLVAVSLAPRLDLSMTRWTHPAAAETRDSPYARITASVSGSQTALFADDVLVYESESSQQEELADVAALQHPDPRRILLLGGAVERLEPELRRHRPERVDGVEMDHVFFDIANRRLHLGSTPVFDDPRDFLRREETYDLIVVAMPQPTSGQSNRFYTVEFFEECRRRLAPGGVLGFRLALPENLVTPLLAMRTASIVAAVRSAFPHVELLQGGSALVLASTSPLPARADLLIDRWRARGLATLLVTPAYLHYLYENDRRAALVRLCAMPVAPNSDRRPVCYPFAAISWLAMFYPDLLRIDPARLTTGLPVDVDRSPGGGGRGIEPAALRDPRYFGVVCLAVLLLLARRRQTVRTAMLAGVAGLSGMLLETVLLLAYQARSGALYERLGLLIMAFMAGLTVGAWAVARIAPPGRAGPVVHRATLVLLVALAVVGILVAELIATGAGMGLPLTSLVLLLGGAAVGGVFACAAAASDDQGGAAVGRLYGADLAGGAIGSFLGSLVLVPLAGLAPTTWIVVGLSLLALLLA